MIAKILEKLTGKDDLERVAYKEDLAALNAYLKKRPVFVPQRPKRFLDAATLTQEELMEQIQQDAEQLSSGQFEPWILEVDGKRRLPVFSSQKRMTAFASRMSQVMDKVFGLGCISILLEDVTKHADIDFVDLNLFSQKSWEIGIRKKG
jgi:SseB protein N-terminal domain